MQYHSLVVDTDGESHWRTEEVPLTERVFAPPAAGIFVSESAAAAATLFLRLPAGWDEPAHPTPVAQFFVCLSGAVEVTASDGEVRRIGAGDVWRMADTHGKGHHTRVVGAEDCTAVMVQLP